MGTLTHRALLQYIESNDLPGLKTFLDTRHLPIDDRDEVSSIGFYLIFEKDFILFTHFRFLHCRMAKQCLWYHRPRAFCHLFASC